MPKQDLQTQDDQMTQDTPTMEELQTQLLQLQKKLKDQEDITQRAQSDYFRLKMDWDGYVARTEEMKSNLKVESLIKIAQKLLPAVSQLKQSVDTMPAELKDSPRAQWVHLIYTKISSQLEGLNIAVIDPVLWIDPDLTLHIPLSTQPTDDDAMKGKVTTVIETWYLYQKDDAEKVIIPAKVVVGE